MPEKAMSNNNNYKKDNDVILLSMQHYYKEKCVYNPFELPPLGKLLGGGSGHLYCNSISETYEIPAAIDFLPARLASKVLANRK